MAMSDPNDASGYSKTDLISQGFIHTPELKALVDNTQKVADLDVAAFDAIVVAGGPGERCRASSAQRRLLAQAPLRRQAHLVQQLPARQARGAGISSPHPETSSSTCCSTSASSRPSAAA
jgi:hypothetical protein